MSSDLRRLLRHAETLGWTLSGHGRRGGHLRLRHTSGAQCTISCTPSDRNWHRQVLRDLRKAAMAARDA